MHIGPVEIKRRTRGAVADKPETLSEVVLSHDIIGIVDNPELGEILIVAPHGGSEQYFKEVLAKRPVKLADSPSVREIGASGTKWRRITGGEEYNSTLAGLSGIETYEKMRRGDASVRSSLRLAKTPILGGRWYVEPYERGNTEAEMQAEYISNNLFRWMTISWPQFLTESLAMLDFGWYAFEKVFDTREWNGRQLWYWRKFAPRHPYDLSSFYYDEHGGPAGASFEAWEGAQSVDIDIDKLLIFTFDKEAGNLEGISLLRSAYKHWYFKDNLYKIDAIQKERHGIGVPIIKLPPGYTTADKNMAHEIGRNLRTNEMAHIVMPPNWEIGFVKVEGNPVDAMASIEHHDKKIYDNILGQFLHTGGNIGKENEIDLYMKAQKYIADVVRDVINKHAIPQLCQYNWDTDEFPELKVRRIGETADWRTMSFAIRNFIGAKVIIPDEKLEEWVRYEMDLPQPDEDTARIVETPQAPGGGGAEGGQATPTGARVGMPRQGPPSTATGSGGAKANTGIDKSGG
jgi:hypothetical protein